MKKIYFILFINIIFFFQVNSQDYFPIELGRYWIYDLFNESGDVIGRDSAIMDSSYISGSDEIFRLHKFVDTISGGSDEVEQFFYSSGNDVLSQDIMGGKVAQHSYSDGDKWSIFDTIHVEVDSLGNDTVPYGIMDQCFRVYTLPNFFNVNIDVIYAPDVGAIKYYSDGKVERELRRKGLEIITGNPENIVKYDVRLYPMPVTDILNVRMPFDVAIVEVVDIMGVKVLKETIHSESAQLNLSGLVKGVYFVIISNDGKQIVRKIIVK